VQPLVIYPCVEAGALPVKKPSSDRLQLLTVSRLVERKGHTLVLNTIASLRHTGQLQDFEYHIIGTGPMQRTLQSMTHELGLDGHVQFHGDVTDDVLQTFYTNADVFVMPVTDDPIDKEGFGYVFLEAAVHATPSITSRIPGVDEAVIDGETGILIEPNNQIELAQAIVQLAGDASYRTELGTNAYTRTQTAFSCKEQFSKLDPYL
jgi:glycosyltransferase involved in cell wall biosynthesis